jgi:hypothetical protein
MTLDSKVFTDIQKNEILKQLQLEYDVFPLVTTNEFKIRDQIEKNPYYQEQFRLLYLAEKSRLMELEIVRDAYIGQLYDDLKHKNDVILSKVEIERFYIPKDSRVIKLRKLELEIEIRMQFFEAVWEAFKTQGWQLKLWVDINK